MKFIFTLRFQSDNSLYTTHVEFNLMIDRYYTCFSTFLWSVLRVLKFTNMWQRETFRAMYDKFHGTEIYTRANNIRRWNQYRQTKRFQHSLIISAFLSWRRLSSVRRPALCFRIELGHDGHLKGVSSKHISSPAGYVILTKLRLSSSPLCSYLGRYDGYSDTFIASLFSYSRKVPE